jgi:hypothetical protein
LVLAIVGFVAVFFLFGMMVAPFVVPVYRTGGFGLTLPPISASSPSNSFAAPSSWSLASRFYFSGKPAAAR